MTKKETQNNSNLYFQSNVNYQIPSIDRPCKYVQEDGTTIYLTEEQKNFLLEEYWENKTANFRNNRCYVFSETHHTAKCKEDCSTCKWFHDKKKSSGTISLDDLQDKYNYEPIDSFSTEENYNKMELHEKLLELIEKLEDTKDKEIINYLLEGKNETEIGKLLGISQRAVAKRRTKISLLFQEPLKSFR